jgi:Calpain family cysteine protease
MGVSSLGQVYIQDSLIFQIYRPLLEKAYAKFRGDYASLDGGSPAEAPEGLTG